jgi:hypothetical protein
MAATVLDDRELQRIYSWVRVHNAALPWRRRRRPPPAPPPILPRAARDDQVAASAQLTRSYSLPRSAAYPQVDEIPLSRPKRSITRDFSDGVLMAELVHHYFPKLVESA